MRSKARHQLTQWIFGIALVALGQSASAYVGMCCGKCGGNMPLNIPGAGIPEPGEYRFKVNVTDMVMDGLKIGTDSVSPGNTRVLGNMMTPGPYMMAPTRMNMRMLNATVGHSFNDDFFAMLMFMHMDKNMDMINRMGVTSKMDSSGIGDTMLMTKYLLYADDKLIPRSQASVLLGLNIPTGSIDETNSTGTLLPYGMQLGSGTWDPVVGLLYSGSSSPWWWGINGIYTARIQDNDRDYRLGDEFRVDAYGMHQLSDSVLAEFQINGQYNGKIEDTAAGTMFMSTLQNPDNYGGKKMGATVGLQWQPAPYQIINLQYSKNLYSDLNGPQLEEDHSIMLTWYYELVTAKSRRSAGFVRDKDQQGDSKLGF